MSFLFDTSAISEVFKKRPNQAYMEWLDALPRSEQFTSTIVVAELLAGARSSTAPDKWLARYQNHVFPRVSILPFDGECAVHYSHIWALLRSQGNPIGDMDTLIAATALRHDLTIVTANLKHFTRVPDLSVRGLAPEKLGNPKL